ncbi:MAG: cyclic nucleotide-binding domain-containing protein [Oceanicoccus sp.]|uniref:Crp/Fnr family transcriptional regulator n=1 Tax=Oceanicoccus sp. TaxID=2691044 RepID=UPI002631D0ED|nr:cyclic nucleotide-binding domain-containing protein [Oceanicoccus sp.]MCP3907225.1 cyclic nucleotide-binding domain-containing protein [Oceanicoccus sp.]MDG1772576.1 cyclic nucleotide-binding domain-containing protein [Oceanicoccus sp.]
MTAEERIHLLQSMPFFGAINDNSVALILGQSETFKVVAGDYFFHQGEKGDSLYLIEQGRTVIFKQHDAKEYILRYAEDGDCFGELALIDFTPRSASVRAETDCTAIKIPSSALLSLYQQDPEQFLIIQMNIGREVSRRLRASDDRWFQLQIASRDVISS